MAAPAENRTSVHNLALLQPLGIVNYYEEVKRDNQNVYTIARVHPGTPFEDYVYTPIPDLVMPPSLRRSDICTRNNQLITESDFKDSYQQALDIPAAMYTDTIDRHRVVEVEGNVGIGTLSHVRRFWVIASPFNRCPSSLVCGLASTACLAATLFWGYASYSFFNK